jgi:hypothetical protein
VHIELHHNQIVVNDQSPFQSIHIIPLIDMVVHCSQLNPRLRIEMYVHTTQRDQMYVSVLDTFTIDCAPNVWLALPRWNEAEVHEWKNKKERVDMVRINIETETQVTHTAEVQPKKKTRVCNL